MEKTINLNRAQLVNLVNKAGSLAGTSKEMPILNDIKVSFGEKVMCVRSTDADNFIKGTAEIANEADNEFSFCVDKNKFSLVLNSISDDNISLVLDDNNVTIKHSKGNISIPVDKDELYPEVSLGGESKSFTIPSSVLFNFVKTARNFVSSVLADRTLTGINLFVANGHVGCMATNKNIVYMDGADLEEESGINASVVINNHSFIPIMEACRCEDVVRVDIRTVNVLFTCGEMSICSRIMDGVYPSIERVIPHEFAYTPLVNKKALMDAVSRLMITSSDSRMSILEFGENKIKYSSGDISKNQKAIEEIDYDEQLNFKIGINVELLQKALRAIECDNVCIEMNAYNKPLVFADSLNVNRVIMLLPMLFNEKVMN